MVGITTATVIILLSGGGEVENFLTTIKKGVKTHVEDRDQEKAILAERKALSKELKKLEKEISRHLEELTEVHMDYHSTAQDFDEASMQLVSDQKKTAELIINAREEMKARMTSEEWEAVFRAEEE